MKEILESLDLSNEVKQTMNESFDAAVLSEATKLAEEKEAEYKEYIQEKVNEMQAELEETLDSYLDKVVSDFVAENAEVLEEGVQSEKTEALLEGFNALLVTSGVELAQIVEAKEIKDTEDVIVAEKAEAETAELADSLMEEVIELKAKNAKLLKTGLIKESMEDMTVVQKDKFLKLSSVVEFNEQDPVDFITKLDTIVELVKNDASEKHEKEEVLEESTKKEETTKYVSQASHLY